MKNITLQELYEFYIDTINKCGNFLINESDEFVEYNIFEEFDIGVISFLHEKNLKKLLEEKYINFDQMETSVELREMVLELQNKNMWNITAFRSSEEWKKVLQIGDDLKNKLS